MAELTKIPENVKIVALTGVSFDDENKTVIVYGLGDDNKLYSWSGQLKAWIDV